MKKLLSLFSITLLVGCAIEPIHFDGASATYKHFDSDFAAAMLQGKQKCESVGKGIKHESTACSTSRQCVSTFVCVAK